MPKVRTGNKGSSIAAYTQNIVLSLFTFASLFAAAEICARVWYHPPNLGTVIRFDPNLGWALIPNSYLHSVDHRRGLDYTIRTNSHGLREREFALEKKPGTKRILFIGDSVTFGTGVDAGWRFSDFTGRALDENVEVINAGVPGYGNDQELIYYETLAARLHPDVVVLTVTMANDVVNNALDHLFLGSAPKPRFCLAEDSLVLVGKDLASPSRRPSARKLLRKSRFLLFVKRRLDRGHDVERLAHDSELLPPGFGRKSDVCEYSHWCVFEKTYEPEIYSAWKVTEAILCRLSEKCRLGHIDLIVLCFPLKIEVDDRWRGSMLKRAGIDSTLFDFRAPYERLSAFCSAHSIEHVYPLDLFRAASQNHALYFERDAHPNKYGHALAARVVLERLKAVHHMEFHVAGSDLEYVY